MIILYFLIVIIGTCGYLIIEGWEVMDSLYMTVITLTTIGYGEVNECSPAGRLFTMFFIFIGVGFNAYVVGNVIQFLVEGRIRHVFGRYKLEKEISRLKNHYIICGYGRIGRVLCEYLKQKKRQFVVVECDESRTPTLNADEVLYIIGSATSEANLTEARIENARGLVAVLGTDADNVFLVLKARHLNPKLFIVARSMHDDSKKTLYAAGADNVISPYDLGARRIAHAILRPTVIHFLELAFADQKTDIQLEEISVTQKSELVGKELKDSGIRQKLNLIIIAVKKSDGSMLFNPQANTVLNAGDTVIVVGQNDNLFKLSLLLDPP